MLLRPFQKLRLLIRGPRHSVMAPMFYFVEGCLDEACGDAQCLAARTVAIIYFNIKNLLRQLFNPLIQLPSELATAGECELLKAQEHPFIMQLGKPEVRPLSRDTRE